MSLKTTTIGAYPKPDYVRLPDWFKNSDGPDCAEPTRGWATALADMGAEAFVDILSRIDLDKLAEDLWHEVKTTKSKQKRKKVLPI